MAYSDNIIFGADKIIIFKRQPKIVWSSMAVKYVEL